MQDLLIQCTGRNQERGSEKSIKDNAFDLPEGQCNDLSNSKAIINSGIHQKKIKVLPARYSSEIK